MCPVKKDCVSIRNKDGSKEKVQKRLLLGNIFEINRFSTFALLQPKRCMPVDVAGSYNVCVCAYHQNVKLMLNTVNTSLNYNDVLKLCVCSTENSDCMLHHCDLRPGQTVVCNFLKEQ